MDTRLLFTGALLLVVVGGGVVWWQAQPQSVANAALAPAAGHEAAAEGEGAPPPAEAKKSHSGKVLSAESTIPMVTIGGKEVITRKMLYQQELEHATPEPLKHDGMAEMLRRRVNVGGYAHNPTKGEGDARLQVIEMTDLSCVQCMETSKVVDASMDEFQGKIRLVNVHTPVNRFNDVNMAAFYGKVAQRGGVFWEYRKALQTLQNPNSDSYFETLVQVGMDRLQARRLVQTESRRFYRELDADTQLSQSLNLGNPPHVFVNGIHVGINAIPLDKLHDVVVYELNRPREMESTVP
ncbi:MAG: thioredoxin domain-containing protein [Alphaproteobacteria bacterium]